MKMVYIRMDVFQAFLHFPNDSNCTNIVHNHTVANDIRILVCTGNRLKLFIQNNDGHTGSTKINTV